jgi:hypothetical protein
MGYSVHTRRQAHLQSCLKGPDRCMSYEDRARFCGVLCGVPCGAGRR